MRATEAPVENNNGQLVSDGTTHWVAREDTRPVFEAHPTEIYPREMKEHDMAKAVTAELSTDKYSLVGQLPVLSQKEQNRKFSKIAEFQYENTYEQIVKRDTKNMVAVVKDEIKDTLGIPRPHRRVQPVKEAAKRIEKNMKSIKHQVAEQVARETMQANFFNPVKNPTRYTDKTIVNPTTDASFRKGLRL